MMKERVFHTVTAAAALAVASVVAGQTTTPQTPTKPTQPQQKDTGKYQADQKQVELRRASKCLRAEVRGSDNEKVGDIKDFAIDSQAGRAVFALISSGGVAGVGDTVRLVPFKALKFGPEDQPIRLSVAKASFDQAPKFEDDDWDRLSSPEFTSTIYRHYNVQPESTSGDFDSMRDGRERDLTQSRDRDRTQPPRSDRDARVDADGNYLKCTDLIGMDVNNVQDEDLGEINDLMLNVRNGQIGYAVLGFGGVLGMGEKLFAVPWQALRFDAQEDHLVLNIDKDRLRDAPGFDRNNWPDMADEEWGREVHAFYGTEPTFIYGYAAADAGAGKAKGWGHDSEYNKKFKSGQTQTITGTIQSVERTRPMSNMSEAVVLQIRTNEGQTIPVHLGPAWFIDNQEVRFDSGDKVTITGARCDIEGKQVVLASEVRSDEGQLALRDQDGKPRWDACKPTSGSGYAPSDRNSTPR